MDRIQEIREQAKVIENLNNDRADVNYLLHYVDTILAENKRLREENEKLSETAADEDGFILCPNCGMVKPDC